MTRTAKSTTATDLLRSGLGAVRTLGLVTAVAGVTVLGLGGTANAAPAPHTAGPDAFVPVDHGVVPTFFCDAHEPHKHHKHCIVKDGPRF